MAEKRIEDAFNIYFTGDTLKNTLDFAEFLRANEMVYDGEYAIHYKNKLACYIDTPNDKSPNWSIWTVGDYSKEYEGFPIDCAVILGAEIGCLFLLITSKYALYIITA